MKKLLAIGAAALILSTTAVGTVGAESSYQKLREAREEGRNEIFILRSSFSRGTEVNDYFKYYLREIRRASSKEGVEKLVKAYRNMLLEANDIAIDEDDFSSY